MHTLPGNVCGLITSELRTICPKPTRGALDKSIAMVV
jgi:hypothetical protein